MKKIVFITLCFCFYLLKAQPPTKFYTRFGGNGDDVGNSVIQALDGQYIVAGSTSSFGNGNTDVYLAKVDTMGWHVLWERSYGGYNNDIGTSVIQIADSGYVIAGYTNSFGSGGYDLLILRTDKNGNLIWQKAFGGMDWEFGYCVKQTPDLGFVVCGKTFSYGYGKSDGYIIKTDINGIFQWQKTYGGFEDDNFKSMVLTYNNMLLFAGTTKSMGDLSGDSWLFKTDMLGDSIFSIKRGVANKIEYTNDVVQSLDNGFISCGAIDTSASANGKTYSYLTKHDEFGNFVWERVYANGLVNDDQFFSLAIQTNASNFCNSRKVSNGFYKLESAVMLTNNAGIYMGMTTYGGLGDEETYKIYPTRDHGYILTGYTTSFSSLGQDVFLLKLDSTTYNSQNIVGIKELTEHSKDVIIYPNSTSNNLNIDYLPKGNFSFKIYNTSGQIVLNGKLLGNIIDVSILSDNIYILELTSENVLRNFKFIKTQ